MLQSKQLTKMLRSVVTASFAFFLLPSILFAAAFVEGKDYQLLNVPADSKPKHPEVVEFFSYGCPWCYKIEASLMQWKNTVGVGLHFDRIPVVYKASWSLYAKAYYTANTLALSDKFNPLLFKAIQEDKMALDTDSAMVSFFIKEGVDKELALSAFEHSPSIDLRVNEGMDLVTRYQINAVPAFVVNQKYKTDLQMAQSQERLFEILNYLIKRS